MKKRYLSLTVATSVMLTIILISTVSKAVLEGIYVFIAYLSALIITYMSMRFYKKKCTNISQSEIAAVSIFAFVISYASTVFAPHLLAIVITSASLGINLKHIGHSLKIAVYDNEG